MNTSFDTIIIGGGSMGSATAYHLAKKGQNVLVLEQFDFIHAHGSHGGQTRLIRKSYFEHSDYVPLLFRAYENWAHLEALTQEKIYFPTGILYFGEPQDSVLASTRASAQLYNLRLETLSMADAKQKYPPFAAMPDDWECLFEPEAGFLLVEKGIQLYLQEALKCGATLKAREKVVHWTANAAAVEVKTTKNTYRARKLIFTAGAWTDKLLKDLQIPLKVTRQITGWVQPAIWDDFGLDQFVCWAISDKEQKLYYGMPILETGGTIGLKLGCHFMGDVVDPDAVNREISETDEMTFRRCLEKYMPAANGEILAVKTCLYTNTPDENFIIDHHPKHENVILAGGFSGHGFKFASVVGEILSDLAMEGKTEQPIGFLSLKRFEKL